MLQEERLLLIRNLLATFSRVTVDRIVQELEVSRETVRRDLVQLEDLGELRRVHGGAVAVGAEPEPPLAVRQAARQKEKRSIAKAAISLMQPGQTVFLDSGSTNTIFAEELATLCGMTVITNSLTIALMLAHAGEGRDTRNHTLLLGGEIDPKTQATLGPQAIAEIHRFRADVALLSPVGIHAKHGAMSFEHHEAAIARAMVEHAEHVVILADHSKIGLTSRVSYAAADKIDTLITDAKAGALPALAALRRQCQRVIVA